MTGEFERLAQHVANAWNNPGVEPSYHELWKRRLRHDWPTLAIAVEKLAQFGQNFG